jgi:hypothetical protein
MVFLSSVIIGPRRPEDFIAAQAVRKKRKRSPRCRSRAWRGL